MACMHACSSDSLPCDIAAQPGCGASTMHDLEWQLMLVRRSAQGGSLELLAAVCAASIPYMPTSWQLAWCAGSLSNVQAQCLPAVRPAAPPVQTALGPV